MIRRNNINENTTTIFQRVPTEHAKLLDQTALERGLMRSSLVRDIIADWVAKQKIADLSA